MTKVILLILWEPLLIICSVVLLHPRELLLEVTAVMEFQKGTLYVVKPQKGLFI